MKTNNLDNTFKKYKKSVNMNLGELKEWKKNPCSKKASIGRAAINRNINLLSKNKNQWTEKDIKEAKKTISFNARMSKVKPGKKVKGCNISKRDISLANWGKKVHSDKIYNLEKDNKSKNFAKYPYTYQTYTIGDVLKKNNKTFFKKFMDEDATEDIVENFIGDKK
jgi:hypothetical protein